MPDYFTKLCTTVPLPANATKFAITLNTALNALACGDLRPDSPVPRSRRHLHNIAVKIHDTIESSSGCEMSRYKRNGKPALLISSEDSASPEAVFEILQATLKHFALDDEMHFQWVHDCSRHLIDAYSGGAVIFNRVDVRWFSIGDWLDEIANVLKQP